MKRTLNKRFIKGFTLVELIIVITILAILATIAFISFQGYSKNARDGNRITTMKNISKGLEVFKVQTGNYPLPDESINVEASGTLIGYQGKVGDTISRIIKINVTPTDPVDKEKYIYSTSSDKTKYQILGYLETPDYLSLLNQSYATDYNSRYVKTLGDKVGIILDTNKNPVSGVAKIDMSTGSTVYNVYFGDNDNVNGSGNVIFSNIYNRRSDLISNKSFTNLDSSLVGYWDMETTISSGGILYLKDLSKNGNNGICYDTGIIVSCGQTGLGPQIITGDGKSGKAMNFDGEDDVIMIPKNDYSFNNLTFVVKLKHSGAQEANNGGGWRFLSSQATDYFFLRINDSYRFDGVTPLVRGNLVFGMSVSGVSGGSTIGNQLIDGKYHTIINTKSSTIRNYVDGNLMNEYDNTIGALNTGDYLRIGGASLIGELFSGVIDEVRVYNRALSNGEVQEIYNSAK